MRSTESYQPQTGPQGSSPRPCDFPGPMTGYWHTPPRWDSLATGWARSPNERRSNDPRIPASTCVPSRPSTDCGLDHTHQTKIPGESRRDDPQESYRCQHGETTGLDAPTGPGDGLHGGRGSGPRRPHSPASVGRTGGGAIIRSRWGSRATRFGAPRWSADPREGPGRDQGARPALLGVATGARADDGRCRETGGQQARSRRPEWP